MLILHDYPAITKNKYNKCNNSAWPEIKLKKHYNICRLQYQYSLFPLGMPGLGDARVINYIDLHYFEDSFGYNHGDYDRLCLPAIRDNGGFENWCDAGGVEAEQDRKEAEHLILSYEECRNKNVPPHPPPVNSAVLC